MQGIVSQYRFWYKANLNELTYTSPEIMKNAQ